MLLPCKAQGILSPGCRRKKKRAHHKHKKNIAMTNYLQAGYNTPRQSVLAIFFLYKWPARFFFRLQSGLIISWALLVRRGQNSILRGASDFYYARLDYMTSRTELYNFMVHTDYYTTPIEYPRKGI